MAVLTRDALLAEIASGALVLDPYDPEGFHVIRRNGSQPNYMRDDHTLKNVGRVFLH